jgi:glucan 1,3-beta-glucosidase
MPTDPREADGVCGNTSPWQPPLAASQTGGSGAGQIPASVASSLAWPPASISNGGAITLLPQYTHTGNIPTLPVPTAFPSVTSSVNAGNGWKNPSDTISLATPIATCSYPNPWIESAIAVPPVCGARSTGLRREVNANEPTITPTPVASR